MIVYLSGPMTGYVNHNREAFHAAEKSLRRRYPHLAFINPAALDATGDHSAWSHADYMKRDLALLLEADAIYLLPGWRWSKGASIEEAVARTCGLLVLEDPDKGLWRTFEGEPEADQEPLRYALTDPPQGDAPTGPEDLSAQTPPSEGRAPAGDEDLADHPRFGAAFADLDITVDDSLPPDTMRLDTGASVIDYTVFWDENGMHLHPKPKYRHADLDKPRRGDRFPNVGYVRRLMALMGLPQPDQSYLDYGERRSA